jgi:hypothetical protein
MCGINAVLLADTSANAAVELVDSLGLLQHRGQVFFVDLHLGCCRSDHLWRKRKIVPMQEEWNGQRYLQL